jgi:hypothetical protein
VGVAGDMVEGLAGGLGPHKRPWLLVPVVDPRLDRLLEFGHRAVGPTTQPPVGYGLAIDVPAVNWCAPPSGRT